VTVNQRFEVFFPEKRPFFMENASYFNTPTTLFFSRRIVDPEYGVRLTGKLGRWGLGVLATDDRAPGQTAALDDPNRGGRASAVVASFQRDLFKDSHVRFLGTDREWASGHNRVASLDTRLNLGHSFFFIGQAATSLTRPSRQAGYSGDSYFAQIRRSGRKLNFFSQFTDVSPGFQADLGYIPRTDIREFASVLSYRWWREKKTLVDFGPDIVVLRNWNRAGRTQDWEVDFEWNMELRRLTYLNVTRKELYELYRGVGFRKSNNSYSVSSEWWKWMAVGAAYSHGDGVNYYPAQGLAPFAGIYRHGSLSLTLRPTKRTRLDETYIYEGFRAAAAAVYNNHIVRSKVNYQFTRELSLRAIVDYNGVLPNTALVAMDRTKRVGYDFLFTYLIHPGTALYVGYTDIYENLRFNPSRPPYLTPAGSPDFNTGRQAFVKLSYLFRF